MGPLASRDSTASSQEAKVLTCTSSMRCRSSWPVLSASPPCCPMAWIVDDRKCVEPSDDAINHGLGSPALVTSGMLPFASVGDRSNWSHGAAHRFIFHGTTAGRDPQLGKLQGASLADVGSMETHLWLAARAQQSLVIPQSERHNGIFGYELAACGLETWNLREFRFSQPCPSTWRCSRLPCPQLQTSVACCSQHPLAQIFSPTCSTSSV
jgi:hypothetical protein